MLQEAKGGDLLYVGSPDTNSVYVYTYPDGKFNKETERKGIMKVFSLRRALGLFALLLVGFISQERALAGTLGGIAGTVTDATTGAPIPGVRLQLTSPSQSATATTDAKGRYIVFSLQPDDYTLTAVKDGYTTQSFSGYSVYADQTQRYDLQLTPVTAGASRPPHMQPILEF